MAPITGSRVITIAQLSGLSLRISARGVMTASIRQYTQTPAAKRMSSTSRGSMAAA